MSAQLRLSYDSRMSGLLFVESTRPGVSPWRTSFDGWACRSRGEIQSLKCLMHLFGKI